MSAIAKIFSLFGAIVLGLCIFFPKFILGAFLVVLIVSILGLIGASIAFDRSSRRERNENNKS